MIAKEIDTVHKSATKLGPAADYDKNWTSHDFYGKYHLFNIKNEAPIPGTQIKVEQDRKAAHDSDVKRYREEVDARNNEKERHLALRKNGAEVILSLFHNTYNTTSLQLEFTSMRL